MICNKLAYYFGFSGLFGMLLSCQEAKVEAYWASDWIDNNPSFSHTIEWADFERNPINYSTVGVWSCRYTSEFIIASIPVVTKDLLNTPVATTVQVKWAASPDFCYGTLVKQKDGWFLLIRMNRWFYRSCNVNSYCPILVDDTGSQLVQLPAPTNVFDLDNQSFKDGMPYSADFKKISRIRASMAEKEIKRVRQELQNHRLTQAEASAVDAKLSGYLTTSELQDSHNIE